MRRTSARTCASAAVAGLLLIAAACGDDDAATTPETSATPAPSAPTTGDGRSTTDGGDATGTAGEPVDGGTVQVGAMFPVLLGAPKEIVGAVTDGVLMRAMYDTFLFLDEDDKVIPWLAEDWTVSDDRTVFTFELRDGVTFHDGTAFDAAAAVWNIEQHLAPDSGTRAAALAAQIESVEATGPMTVTITTSSPYPAFIEALASSPLTAMASPKALQDDPDALVGTGPFRVGSYEASQEARFEANPDYWRDGPYLDEVVIRSILDNDTRTLSLENGEIGVAAFVEGQYFKDLEAKGFTAATNFGTPFVIVMNSTIPPFDDVRVRQAVAYAMDLDAIALAVFDGEATPAPSLMPTDSPWVANGVEWPSYDPERARELVEEYEAEAGPISFTFDSDNIPYMRTVGEIGQQMWGAAGMDVEVEVNETNRYVERMFGGEIAIGGWGSGSAVDPDLAYYNTLHSASSSSVTKYSNTEMDAALDTGRASATEEDRMAAYETVQQLLARDVPLYGYLQTPWGFALDPDVHGWVTRRDSTPDWSTVWIGAN